MAVLGQSSLGTMRLNAARLNYHNTICYVAINGVQQRTNVRYDAFTIRQTVNSTPDSCSLRVWRFTPVAMQDIKIYIGSTAATELIFGGTIQRVTQVAESAQANVAYDLDCVDYSWLMDRRLVFKSYTNVSASAVAADIIANFTTGYTANNVQPGLPLVSIIFTGAPPSVALTQLAQLVGAHWKVSYTKDLRFATASTFGVPDPATITAANSTWDSPLTAVSDGSQVRTRIIAIGKGTTAVAPAAVGSTVLPVMDTTLFTSGGAVVAGQRITYTGVSLPGGTIVGPGAGPTSAPTAVLNSTASSLTANAVYQYAYTDVTGAGETTASPIATITPKSTSLSNPTETPAYFADTAFPGGMTPGGSYQYKFTTSVDGGGETAPGPASATISPMGTSVILIWTIAIGAGTRYVNLYRTTNGGGIFELAHQFDISSYFPNGGTWGPYVYTDTVADGSLGAAAPGSNTATLGSVGLSGIAVGGATVTQRKVYRTVANGSQLKLLTTIANNTATTYTDSGADSTLGANIPTSDTSGLTQPTGTVAPGSTSIRIAGTSAFPSTGGWAVAGGMAIQFTGTDSQNLTGVPASGVGSLTSSLSYGTAIVLPALLTGIPSSSVGSIAAAVNIGDPVRPYTQVDDTAAQTALAALEGGDGIHEDVIDDETLVTDAMRTAAGTAALTLFKAVENQNTFSARDYKLQCGATVTFNVGSPTNITGTRTIQSVTISELNAALPEKAGTTRFLSPLRTVEVGTTRLTLPEFLRQLGL